MHRLDPARLSKTVAKLLETGTSAADGWVSLDELRDACARQLMVDVGEDDLRRALEQARRFELDGHRVRPAVRDRPPRTPLVPDILYHATTEELAETARALGHLSAGVNRQVFLSSDEAQAWRVAHRMRGAPRVLYVDASRARRHGARFSRNRRNGLWTAPAVPVRDILNLQENFAEQISAGGIPIEIGADGRLRAALIRVTRRSGVTWEVAKGKLEPGEPPEHAAVREVKEEMGVEAELTIVRDVGRVRYGFVAPGGLPRLKTVYLYLMRSDTRLGGFTPSEREGIGAVRWFTPAEAARAVTHTSLLPMMRRAQEILESAALFGELSRASGGHDG